MRSHTASSSTVALQCSPSAAKAASSAMLRCDSGRASSWWTPRRTCALLVFLLLFLLLALSVVLWLWWLFAASASRPDLTASTASAPADSPKQRHAVAGGAYRSNVRHRTSSSTAVPTRHTPGHKPAVDPSLEPSKPLYSATSPIDQSTHSQQQPEAHVTSSPIESPFPSTLTTNIRKTDSNEEAKPAPEPDAPRIGAIASSNSKAPALSSNNGPPPLEYCTSTLMSCELPPADSRALIGRGSSGKAAVNTRRAHALLPVKMSNGSLGPRGPQGPKGPDGAPGRNGKNGVNGPPLARVAFFVRLNESLQPNEYELPLDVRFDDVVTDVGHNYDRLNVLGYLMQRREGASPHVSTPEVSKRDALPENSGDRPLADGAVHEREREQHMSPVGVWTRARRAATATTGQSSWNDDTSVPLERLLSKLWGENARRFSTGQQELLVHMRAGDALFVQLKKHLLSAVRGDALTSFSGHLLARLDSDPLSIEAPVTTSGPAPPLSTTSEPQVEQRDDIQQTDELSETQGGQNAVAPPESGENDVDSEPY